MRSTRRSRDFLDAAITDYNAMFGTSYDTSVRQVPELLQGPVAAAEEPGARPGGCRQHVPDRLRRHDAEHALGRQELAAHGLIQAYSRTNRILNSVKTYGNIVSFRDLEEETNDAIALFGNKDARASCCLSRIRDYYTEYAEARRGTMSDFPLEMPIRGEMAQKAFIRLFGSDPAAARTSLSSFDDFVGNEILTERRFPGLPSRLPGFVRGLPGAANADKESINDDIVFEIELIKQVEINVDYILMLVERTCGRRARGRTRRFVRRSTEP